MVTQVFDGVLFEWYKYRLRAMFGRMPCRQARYSNHLLGMCSQCGAGKYAKSKYKITTVALDSVVVYRSSDDRYLHRFVELRRQLPNLQTNLAVPLPFITTPDGRTGLADYYDPDSRTALFVSRYTRHNRSLAEYMEAELARADIALSMLDPVEELWWQVGNPIVRQMPINEVRKHNEQRGSEALRRATDGGTKAVVREVPAVQRDLGGDERASSVRSPRRPSDSAVSEPNQRQPGEPKHTGAAVAKTEGLHNDSGSPFN